MGLSNLLTESGDSINYLSYGGLGGGGIAGVLGEEAKYKNAYENRAKYWGARAGLRGLLAPCDNHHLPFEISNGNE